ncbi:MAG: hypothetical protein COA71_03870 [SAR86 cluster bacterium]|uniref:HTH tetR-type domain-containing protein n=1 Tax=SAR86 cluster bacterium TaxID=2030880 RepID=A0A2A5CFX7_9GAMM|nr:TetR family transcriptional regulator [bacterium AH-315-I11]MBN4075288.1 TetR family transcriptional regulator [Gammaproteobacteria bacterium AH-315-E17]PCJ42653.1 MAG: hypothetical protein COA71_03870 [SAR86 cluster bacterium]
MTQTKRKDAKNGSNASETAFLDAAELIFSERGYDGTSMRAIANEANGNVGALHYYFGSKEALIKKTIERRLRPAQEKCIERLEACWPNSTKEAPDIGSILRAYIKPIVDLSIDVNPEFDTLMRRMLNDPSTQVQTMFHQLLDETTFLFIRLLKKCNPSLAKEEFYWRLNSIMGSTNYMFSNRSDLIQLSSGQFSPSDTEQGVEELIYNISTMYMAPSRISE